jgi:energy-coupling factor transporter ATP-binding protein EcfA2
VTPINRSTKLGIRYPQQNQYCRISFTLQLGERVCSTWFNWCWQSTLLENLIGLKYLNLVKLECRELSWNRQLYREKYSRRNQFCFQDANDRLLCRLFLEGWRCCSKLRAIAVSPEVARSRHKAYWAIRLVEFANRSVRAQGSRRLADAKRDSQRTGKQF